MRTGIEQISDVQLHEHSVHLAGRSGRLSITACRADTYLVHYGFDEAPEPRALRLLAGEFPFLDVSMPPRSADAPGFECRREERLRLHAGDEHDHAIDIDPETGNVSVYRDGRLVHGGPIGTKDTVLPNRHLRVLGPPPVGRFHFPLAEDDEFYGLGEKAGPLNRRGHRYKMFNRDALGYDAEISDPLYKSIPFFIRRNPDTGSYVGLFFPTPVVNEVDFGVESIYYYAVEVAQGPFAYYVFTGDSYHEILEAYTWLTGRPALPPLYSFGYFGSSMDYAEPQDAEERVSAFFDRIEKYQVPCEGIYLSSGYAKADNGQRYSFVWNTVKFAEPTRFVQSVRRRGYRISANLKPGILAEHPWYDWLAERGYLIREPSGAPYREYYWGGHASLVDFANPDAYEWWKQKLREEFFERGITSIWNDNNECELEDPSLPAALYRALYPLLMARASAEVSREQHPGERPWVISRAGWAGLQAYARSWTGDNLTSFACMHRNTHMGLGLGLSGFPYYGHDIGGFFGPTPSEELLIRWCQNSVLHPRFVIHSWNSEEHPTELWTYPDALPVIRELIRERYRFMPYLYNEAVRAHRSGLPMQRPLALEYPGDARLSVEDTASLVGPSLLVPAVTSPGVRSVGVTLPEGDAWYEPDSGRLLEGGSSVELDYPLSGFRYLVRAGSIVPTAPGLSSLHTGFFAEVRFRLYPSAGRDAVYTYYEDDGVSDYKTGDFGEYQLELLRVDGGDGSATAGAQAGGEAGEWILRLTVLHAPREGAATSAGEAPETARPDTQPEAGLSLGLESRSQAPSPRRFSFELPAGFVFTGLPEARDLQPGKQRATFDLPVPDGPGTYEARIAGGYQMARGD